MHVVIVASALSLTNFPLPLLPFPFPSLLQSLLSIPYGLSLRGRLFLFPTYFRYPMANNEDFVLIFGALRFAPSSAASPFATVLTTATTTPSSMLAVNSIHSRSPYQNITLPLSRHSPLHLLFLHSPLSFLPLPPLLLLFILNVLLPVILPHFTPLTLSPDLIF